MDDLVAFLRARLDEDEAAAKAAWGVEWDWRDIGKPFGETPSIAHTVHIGRHDPARVLREVQAKRAILDEHGPHYPVSFPEPSGQPTCGVCHAGGFDWDPENWPCPTVRALAAIYSDHPDYDADWKP